MSATEQIVDTMKRRAGGDPGRDAWRLMFELFLGQKRVLATIAAEFDLSPIQVHLLRRLEPGAPVSMSNLADTLACDASNVTGLVDRLEARGLIERRPADHDRRVKMIAVTEAGVDLRSRLIERMAEPPPPIARLSRADQRILRDVLARALGGAG